MTPAALDELIGRLTALNRRGVGEALASVQTDQLAVLPWEGPGA